MTNRQIIDVVQAAEDGRSIELSVGPKWYGIGNPPLWNFKDHDYRIKPEPPKPREWWFVKNLGEREKRYGWTRHDVKQEGVPYLEQIHVLEVLD